MSIPSYFLVAEAPLLLLIGILIYRFGYQQKNLANVINAIILGILSTILIVGADYIIDTRWHGNYNSLRRLIFYVVVIVAFSAEVGKYLVLRFGFYNKKDFDGPLKGIIYSIFIGLGYAMIATVLFATQIIGKSVGQYQMLFLFTYPLANIVFATCLGFFIGMGKLRKNTFIDNATGLFVAIFFHGLYFFSFVSNDLVLILFTFVGFLIITATLLVRAININKEKED